MQKTIVFLSLVCVLSFSTGSLLFADAKMQETPLSPPTSVDSPSTDTPRKEPSTTRISAFTGKILKNKVRMRLQPNLEGAILRELDANDMVVVEGESDDFYAVQPPPEVKGYVYRTYVLDGVVEGNHVNVRLEPDLSSPVIAQLNSGNRINGAVSARDKKWLEISLPQNTHFYVAKEYITKIGDASHMARLNKRRDELNQLMSSAIKNSQEELQKPFDQINLDPINKDLNKIVAQFSDFSEESAKAKEMLTTIQTAYLSKKIAYMEAQPKQTVTVIEHRDNVSQPPINGIITSKMSFWLPSEQKLYEEWTMHNQPMSMDDYYKKQAEDAITLKGIIEPYDRPIKNRPGDYLLTDSKTHLPIAYLYSTQINLQENIGQEVSVKGVPRDNHHFAYPAYFILSFE